MSSPAMPTWTDQTRSGPAAPDLFGSHPASHPMHRPIPAPEPNPEPNPGPDAITCNGCGCIDPKDWDVMFLAIQERLEGCVKDAGLNFSDSELRERCIVTETVVLECIQAMKQLHSALTTERTGHHSSQPPMQPPV